MCLHEGRRESLSKFCAKNKFQEGFMLFKKSQLKIRSTREVRKETMLMKILKLSFTLKYG